MTIQELEKFSNAFCFYDVRDQLKRYIYGRSEHAFVIGDAARDTIHTPEDLGQRQKRIRKFFIDSLGGLPSSSDSNLRAKTVDSVKRQGFTIEKVIFESRPKHFVTANLYLPNGLNGRRGAVLFFCGHHEQAKHMDEYQTVCQILAQAGLIVLSQDPIGQGERLSYYEPALKISTVDWGIFEHDYAGVQCQLLGDTIGRYFLHDAMRGLDYLISRPEVDPQKIGVTGNSGGGTQTSMMMMADPRIAVAVPATFIMNRHTFMLAGRAQDAEQIWPGFTAAGFDHEDILLSMAPKPVRVLAVTYDFFPIEGTRRTVERCRRFWGMYNKMENLSMVEDVSTHAYTEKMARSAAEFFYEHLLGKMVSPTYKKVRIVKPSNLWCTTSGQVRGEMKGARFVYEENIKRLKEFEGKRNAIPEKNRRERAIAWLRKKVFKERRLCNLNQRLYLVEQMEKLRVEMGLWWSQDGVFNHGYLFRDCRYAGKNLPVTVAVWDGGTSKLQPHISWVRSQCRGGRAVMTLDVSGAGALAPNPLTANPPLEFYGVIHKFANDLTWLDDDLAALRTFDVIRAIDMIAKWPGLDTNDTRLYAHGRHGLYAQLAAALDERVKRIEVVEGLGSFTELVKERHYDSFDIKSVVLRGVLQYFDLPDLKRWNAKR